MPPERALRRSLLIWGWGQASSGDPRWWAAALAQIAAVALFLAALPFARGTSVALVFLLGVALLVAWAAVGVHAWHLAAREQRRAGGTGTTGSGAPVMWLIPLLLVLGAGPWIAGGPDADPALALDAYLADWRAGRAESAAGRFVQPPPPSTVRAAWEGQSGALSNAVVRLVSAEPGVAADAGILLDGLRWVDAGPADGGGRLLALEAARSERVRNLVFGVLPTTSQRLVPVERLGLAMLRETAVGSGVTPLGPVVAWRIERIEIAGVALAPR